MTPQQFRLRTTIFFALSGLITASWSSRIPDVQASMGLDDAAWGGLLAALPAGLIAVLPLSGWLVTRAGTRRTMRVAVLLFCVLLVALGRAPSPLVLTLCLFLFGAVRTVLNLAVNTQSVAVQAQYSKPIVSLFHGVWSLACFAAIGLGNGAILLGWPPYVHFGVMALLVGVAGWWASKPHPGLAEPVPARRPFFAAPDRYLLLLGGITFCAMYCEGLMFDWSVSFIEREVAGGGAWITAGYTAFILCMAFGRLTGDRAIARFGHTRTLVGNGLLLALGPLVIALSTSFAGAVVGFGLTGLGTSIVVPTVYMLAARQGKMEPGYALASVTLIGSVGFLIAPPITGMLSDSFGLRTAMGAASLLGLGTALLATKTASGK